MAARRRGAPSDSGLADAAGEVEAELRAFLPLLDRLLEHDAEALQQAHELRRSSRDAEARLVAILSSRAFHFACRLAGLKQWLAGLPARFRSGQVGATSVPDVDRSPASTPETPSAAQGHPPTERAPAAEVDNRSTAFAIFRNWVTVFRVGDRRFGASSPLVSDEVASIRELNRVYPLAGKAILELGPLEGANTKQLLDLGARSVTAIEANRELFLKCLVAKNEIPLPAARFVFGDLNEVLQREEFRNADFDLCFASGVLYHMEDPLATIDLVTSAAPVVFVWSHVASDRAPTGEWLETVDRAGRSYRGRKNVYQQTTHIGGVGRQAIWLTPESLRKAFADRGCTLQEMGEIQNANGHAIQFLATRGGGASSR
jgi:phospholipid N-methyltransferase